MGASSDSSWAHDLARHFKREIAQHADGQHPATEVARVARIKPQVIVAPLSSSVTYDEDDILWGIDKKQLKVGDSVLLARDPSDQPAVVGVLDGNDPDPTKHPAGKLLKSRVNEIGSQSRFWKSPMASSAALNAIKTDANGTIRLRLDNGTLYRFNKATLAWVAASGGGGGGGATDLDGLTDVTLSGLSTGQVLRYNGSQWVNYTHDFLTATLAAGTYATIAHTHAQSEITGLVSDLALKAPLANPTFTGTVTVPTVAIGAGNNAATIGAVNTALGSYLTTASAASTYLPLTGGNLTGALGALGTTIGVYRTGDTHNRVQLEANTSGSLRFGSGSTTADWVLYRSAPNVASLLSGDKIQQNAAPTVGDDLTNKTYVDSLLGGAILLPTEAKDNDLLTYDSALGKWTNSYNIAYELDQKADLTDLNLLVNRYGDSMTGDLKLQRPTYGEPLQVFDTDGTTKRLAVDTDGTVAWTVSTINTLPLVTKVSGDTHDRFILFPTGAHQWGPGTGAIDTWLWRNSAGVLYVEEYLRQVAAPYHADDLTNKAYVDSVAIPPGGATNDIITKDSPTDGDVSWSSYPVVRSDTPPADERVLWIDTSEDVDDLIVANAGHVGDVFFWPFSTMPNDCIECDGSQVTAAAWPELHTHLVANGNPFGTGGGNPLVLNMKGRVPVGHDTSQTEFDVLGETGGAKTHTLAITEIPDHRHEMPNAGGTGVTGYDDVPARSNGGADTGFRTGTVRDVASGFGSRGYGSADPTTDQPHNNLQPYVVGKWVMRAATIYSDAVGHSLVSEPDNIASGYGLVYIGPGNWQPEKFATQQEIDLLREELEEHHHDSRYTPGVWSGRLLGQTNTTWTGGAAGDWGAFIPAPGTNGFAVIDERHAGSSIVKSSGGWGYIEIPKKGLWLFNVRTYAPNLGGTTERLGVALMAASSGTGGIVWATEIFRAIGEAGTAVERNDTFVANFEVGNTVFPSFLRVPSTTTFGTAITSASYGCGVSWKYLG